MDYNKNVTSAECCAKIGTHVVYTATTIVKGRPSDETNMRVAM